MKELQLAEKRALNRLEADVNANTEALYEAEAALAKLYLKTPFQATEIVQKKLEIEQIKRVLDELDKLKKEEF